MGRLLTSKYQKLAPYVPGEQPQDKKYIKLNTNESPYPPSEKTLDAVSRVQVSALNLYPDPDAKNLTKALAERYGVNTDEVFLSNGSDDILNFAFMAFCDESHPAVFAKITYGFYKVYAELHSVPYREIPMESDFSINPDLFKNQNCSIILANPNAQTGIALPLSQIEEIVKTNPDNLVLVDEAYVDFGGESAVELTKKYDNLLVVGTFSKSRSLAGARLGFAIANRELIGDLNRIKYSTNPYNINRLTMVAGVAAIEDDAYYMANAERIKETRDYTASELRKRGFEVTDSSANFILAGKGKIPAEKYYSLLKDNGVLVRYFGNGDLEDYVRISIGTREQMQTLIDITDKLFAEEN